MGEIWVSGILLPGEIENYWGFVGIYYYIADFHYILLTVSARSVPISDQNSMLPTIFSITQPIYTGFGRAEKKT